MEMSQETSLRLFEEGGIFVFLDVPVGTEVGIDMQSWNTGNKFRGIKMIPPGLHFIHFSAVNKEGNTAPRTGFFQHFAKRQIVVKRYNPAAEDLVVGDASPEDLKRIEDNLRELDKFLGCYPYDHWRTWISLTNRISARRHYNITSDLADTLQKLGPTSGRILSAPELILDKDQSTPESSVKRTKLEEAEAMLPKMTEEPASKINYSVIPNERYPPDSTPAEISKHSLDSSYKFETLLSQYNKPEEFLAEVQFAFVNFLVGQNYTSFEHWKSLVQLISFSEAAILRHQDLYLDFVSDLYFQIANMHADLFTDIVTRSNVVYACVQALNQNIFECHSVGSRLRSKMERFCKFLEGKFGWTFDTEDFEAEDEKPVVVELGE